LETAVNTGETDIGHLVKALQTFHDYLADSLAREFHLPLPLDVALNPLH
jgi:hypothetical protein